VIATVVGDLRWDASLSGAAAGVALASAVEGPDALQRWRVREALWRAGYPYPVYSAAFWTTEFNAPPPADLITWVSQRDERDDLGVVRARGAEQDHWVVLAARPRVSLDALPRTLPEGGTLVLPPNPGFTWAAGDPDGAVTTGPLGGGARVPMATGGEWLLQIRDPAGVAASALVYVDMPLPEERLLEPGTAATPGDAVMHQIERIRDLWELPMLDTDPLLEAAAKGWQDDPERDPNGLTVGLGFEGTPVSWRCSAASVPDCLDQVVWEPATRAAFIDPEHTSIGLAITTGNRIAITGFIGTPLSP